MYSDRQSNESKKSENDSDSPAETPAAPAVKKHVPVKSKWEGEDEEDNGPVVSSFACIQST